MKAAWEGFWEALARYNLNRNNGLWAFAVKFIVGAVCDCVTDHHNRGGKLETRAARKNRASHKPIHIEYNGVEKRFDQGGRDADGERYGSAITGHIASDDNVTELN